MHVKHLFADQSFDEFNINRHTVVEEIWKIVIQVFQEHGIVGFHGMDKKPAELGAGYREHPVEGFTLEFGLTFGEVIYGTSDRMLLPDKTEELIKDQIQRKFGDHIDVTFYLRGHGQAYYRAWQMR